MDESDPSGFRHGAGMPALSRHEHGADFHGMPLDGRPCRFVRERSIHSGNVETALPLSRRGPRRIRRIPFSCRGEAAQVAQRPSLPFYFLVLGRMTDGAAAFHPSFFAGQRGSVEPEYTMENCPGGGRRCASQCRECLEEGKAFFVEQAPVSSVSRRHAGTRGTFRDGSLLSGARISSLRIVGPMENADHCPCAVPENGQRGGGAQAASAYLFGMIPEKEKLDETGR